MSFDDKVLESTFHSRRKYYFRSPLPHIARKSIKVKLSGSLLLNFCFRRSDRLLLIFIHYIYKILYRFFFIHISILSIKVFLNKLLIIFCFFQAILLFQASIYYFKFHHFFLSFCAIMKIISIIIILRIAYLFLWILSLKFKWI